MFAVPRRPGAAWTVIHPRVEAELQARGLAELARPGCGVGALVEVPLLFETGREAAF